MSEKSCNFAGSFETRPIHDMKPDRRLPTVITSTVVRKQGHNDIKKAQPKSSHRFFNLRP
jgi:hypothetical protein